MAKKKKKAAPKKKKKAAPKKKKKAAPKKKKKKAAPKKKKKQLLKRKRKKLLKRRKREDRNTSIFQENFNLKFSFSYLFQKDKTGFYPVFFIVLKQKVIRF